MVNATSPTESSRIARRLAFTTVGVAVVAYVVIPAITWPAAFALGAVVAPPDAVSATAIARRIGIPRRIVTILEGESLLNDATALVALRTAIGVGGSVTVPGRRTRLRGAAFGGSWSGSGCTWSSGRYGAW